MAKVSELVKSCLLDFNTLISSDGLAGKIQEVPLQAWRDELGRLRVWVANIGAHQTGQSSLDYRLRDASHISGQIMSLLRRIKELLLDLTEILEEDTAMATSADDGPEDFGQHLTDEHEMTEIQQIHQGLLEAITQLYQMSIIIRQPAHHDRLIGTQKNDIEPFIFWARQHASHKYPHADELIIDRISSMMARGKAILRYRERHHSKLSRGIDPEDEQSTVLSETVVTDVYNETNQCHDMASQSGITQTSYRDTLLGGTDEGGRPIPPIPKDGIDQSPFECPYCFYIITVRDDQAWARHIFQDVMPYICIFPDCPTPNKPYENRRSWYAHIQQKHPLTGTSYDCSICRQDSLPSVTFKQHVAGHLQELALLYVPNTRIGEDENLQASALFEENGNIGEKSERVYRCWMCDARYPSLGALKRHLAAHEIYEVIWCCTEKDCKKITFRHDRIQEHMAHIHGIHSPSAVQLLATKRSCTPPTSCPICFLSTTSWDEFYRHIKEHCLVPSS